MKISASLYSNRDRTINSLVTELDKCHIDLFHIDSNDDLSVFDDIREIRKISDTPIDLHIISDEPEKYFDLITAHQIEFVSFQFENFQRKMNFPANGTTKYGLAVISDTPVNVFDEYIDQCDYILIMTTTPGQSGGKFRKDNFRKIREFRNLYPGKKIQVDGGVNDEVGFLMRMLGVDSVVSGSYLVKHESIGTALLHLRSSVIHSDYQIGDFMIDLLDSPVLSLEAANTKNIIESIDAHRKGFTCIVDKDGTLTGISSNADVRRGLLKNIDDFNKLSEKDIINYQPVTIRENATISEMLQLIKSKNFLISFLPVINSEEKLTGCITFFNLIRSES
ncbi:MAG: CBS domain-containing protein [Cyclobacteriaceae bacterium]